jgi:hypothetical protein
MPRDSPLPARVSANPEALAAAATVERARAVRRRLDAKEAVTWTVTMGIFVFVVGRIVAVAVRFVAAEVVVATEAVHPRAWMGMRSDIGNIVVATHDTHDE